MSAQDTEDGHSVILAALEVGCEYDTAEATRGRGGGLPAAMPQQ